MILYRPSSMGPARKIYRIYSCCWLLKFHKRKELSCLIATRNIFRGNQKHYE